MQKRMLGPCLAAVDGFLISVVVGPQAMVCEILLVAYLVVVTYKKPYTKLMDNHLQMFSTTGEPSQGHKLRLTARRIYPSVLALSVHSHHGKGEGHILSFDCDAQWDIGALLGGSASLKPIRHSLACFACRLGRLDPI
jgi:hypothetical protein